MPILNERPGGAWRQSSKGLQQVACLLCDLWARSKQAPNENKLPRRRLSIGRVKTNQFGSGPTQWARWTSRLIGRLASLLAGLLACQTEWHKDKEPARRTSRQEDNLFGETEKAPFGPEISFGSVCVQHITSVGAKRAPRVATAATNNEGHPKRLLGIKFRPTHSR